MDERRGASPGIHVNGDAQEEGMSGERGRDQELRVRTELGALTDNVAVIRKELAQLEQRVRTLEIREELLESPSAAGDEPVRDASR
jgi:hypothetical protein